jgi:hypothetical protein
MSTRAPMTGLAVLWSTDEPVEDQAALALLSQLRQLVQALWQRLPAEVQAIIACDLRRVVIIPGRPRPVVTYGHVDEEMLLCLADAPALMQEEFEEWKPALTWVIVCGFGRAFLWSLLTRLVGVNPMRQEYSAHAEGLPGGVWLTAMVAGGFGDPSIRTLLHRMIEGLALAWGFGAELATVLELEICQPLEGAEHWGLAPDLRRIAQVLQCGNT